MMPAHIATRVSSGPPRNILWTVDQFHYLGDLGMFEGHRAWLVDGVIVEEGPMNPPHGDCAGIVRRSVAGGVRYWLAGV